MEWIKQTDAKPASHIEVLTNGPSGTSFAKWMGDRWLDWRGNDITPGVTHFALIDPLPEE